MDIERAEAITTPATTYRESRALIWAADPSISKPYMRHILAELRHRRLAAEHDERMRDA